MGTILRGFKLDMDQTQTQVLKTNKARLGA